MAEERSKRRLAAILAADVVGYTRLMQVDEAGTLATLKARRRNILQPILAKHSGRIIKAMGDGVLVEFASAVDAVECAARLQEAMAAANAGQPQDHHIILRIGVNLGDVIVEGSDLYGEGVIIAVRLQEMAAPGAICLSGSVHQQIENRLPLAFEDLGPCEVKNTARPVQVFQVRIVGQQADRPAARQPPQSKPSVAILPFANVSGDSEQAYFADGISEDIITELTRFRELSVTGRNSSFVYRDKTVNLQQIGRELGVQYLLEGSVRKVGSRVRITAQLVDTTTGAHIWAERYDREMQGIFDVQDEITGMIVATLSGQIKSATMERAKRKPLASWRAYDCYLMGMEFYNLPRTGKNSKDNLNRAIQLFRKAIEIDPQYARAYGKLGASYTLLATHTCGDHDAHATVIVSAREYAQKGVSLDGSDADALLALGYVLLWEGNFAEAEHVIERGYALNPHDAHVAMGYVTAMSYLGNAERAIALAEAIIHRNPRHSDSDFDLFDLAVAHFFARHHEDSVALFDRLPEIAENREIVAAAYAHAGRIDEAHRHAILYVEELQANWVGAPTADVSDYLTWQFQYNCPYKRRPEDAAHVREGLRKAGLPV